MDKLSIRNHVYSTGSSYAQTKSVTPWQQRLAPSAGSAYQPEPPRDAVLEMIVVMDNPVTGYGVEYEVLICADLIPAQNGGMWDPSWPAHFGEAEAWYHRENRGWKRLELDRQGVAQVERELEREMSYIEVYGPRAMTR
jgi:hypothetical protein